jgi:hypothetical protein
MAVASAQCICLLFQRWVAIGTVIFEGPPWTRQIHCEAETTTDDLLKPVPPMVLLKNRGRPIRYSEEGLRCEPKIQRLGIARGQMRVPNK